MNIETHLRRLRWPTQPEYHDIDNRAHENLVELRREQAMQSACILDLCILVVLVVAIASCLCFRP